MKAFVTGDLLMMMVQKIKNIGILAHVDAGKTTLTEQLLYLSGATSRPGRVDSGDTVTDSMDIERRRGITVKASTTSLEWRGAKINLIDTPGHMDFVSEVERTFSVLDGAVLVLSAREGVQSQTRVIFHLLARYRIPTLLFLNKIDRQGVDVAAVQRQIATLLTGDFLPLQEATIREDAFSLEAPPLDKEAVAEAIAYADETLFDRLAGGEVVGKEAYGEALARATASCRLYPLLYGAALKGVGVEAILDAMLTLLPDAPISDGEPGGYVYKVDWDERHTRRAYIRLFCGSITLREELFLAEGEAIKVKNLLRPERGRLAKVEFIPCGDVALILGEERLTIGSVVGRLDREVPVAATEKATLQVRVTPMRPEDRGELFTALRELAQEDPALHVVMDKEQGAATMRVLGETQREILEALLRERYGLEALFGGLRTIYRERPAGTARAVAGWRMPNPYAADIALTVSPGEPGSGIRYITGVSYGYLTTSFQKAVEEGVLEGCRCGLYGWELSDAVIEMDWAYYDSVTSTPADFRNLAPFVLDRALRECGTVLMEPLYRYHMEIPNAVNGKALYDIERMRGVVENVEAGAEMTILTGTVPAETARDYAKELLSYTAGKGNAVFRSHRLSGLSRGHCRWGRRKTAGVGADKGRVYY
jgi:ribosomal protection tetracycline resistance protein